MLNLLIDFAITEIKDSHKYFPLGNMAKIDYCTNYPQYCEILRVDLPLNNQKIVAKQQPEMFCYITNQHSIPQHHIYQRYGFFALDEYNEETLVWIVKDKPHMLAAMTMSQTTDAVVKAAIDSDISVLQHISYQSPHIQMYAVQRNVKAIEYIRHPCQEVIDHLSGMSKR